VFGFLFKLIGSIFFIAFLLIVLSCNLLWKISKFFWKFTPWAKAKRDREFKEQNERDRQYNSYINDLRCGWISQMNPLIYIDGKIKYIYVYTTDTEVTFNRYKVGETKRSPYDRIQEQDSTSNSGELRLVAYWHAGRISDKDIHRKLESLGYHRVRQNREWFVIDDPLTVIPKLLMESNL
jgi:hypothetical protein